MLKGKSALVTGSTAGLGLAIARKFAANGCSVALNGLAAPAEMASIVDAIKTEFKVDVIYHRVDLTDPAAIGHMVAVTAQQLGGLDILVNNAVVRQFAAIESLPVERWNEALAVNISAPFHAIRAALPHMRARGWGRIINMASIYSHIASANRVDYVTTKTAMLGLTRVVALETLNDGITCNALCPGSVLTEVIDQRVADLARGKGVSFEVAAKEYLIGKQPAGRFVETESVAAAALFLCSDGAKDMTGISVPIDLGWSSI
jgi:3-hydroxybutyrate dehydrogenase